MTKILNYFLLAMKGFASLSKAGGVTICNALRSFAINKLLAVFLPPSAFACVGQFQNLMSIGYATSSLALQNGWTSLTAKYKDDEKQLLGVWHGGFRITTFATIFTMIAAILFCVMAPLETLFPGVHPRLVQTAIIFALPGILATNITTISAATMAGLGETNRWAVINMVTALWQVIWVAFFLYTGRLSVLSIIATQSIVAGVFAGRYASRAGFSLKRVWSTTADVRSPWFSFALMGIVPMILTPIVLTVIRMGVDANFGHDAAGIWQSIYKISDFIFMMMSAVLAVTLLPKISAVKDRESFNRAFYPQLLLVMALAVVTTAVLYFARSLVVPLLFSRAYMGAADYMLWQLVGDVFRTGGYALALVLFARQETKLFLGIEICCEILQAIATFVAMRFFEFDGPMIAFAFENFVYFISLFVVVRRLKWNIQ